MRHVLAVLVAFGFLGAGAEAKAQYRPVRRPGLSAGTPYANPPRTAYPRGYQAVTPRLVRPPNPTGYVNRPYYGAYGYGNYSNGSTDGFPPFRGQRSR